jgi:outer membrane immunogenic protein
MRRFAFLAAGVGAIALASITPAAAQGVDRWSGFYIGAHAGGAWTDASWDQVSLTAEQIDFSRRGFAGGGHLGLQQQFGNIVAGVEIAYSALNGNSNVVSPLAPNVSYSAGIDNLLTVTGRLGFTANQWLLYVKGGWASAKIEYKGAESTVPDSFSISDRTTGWVLGAGVEYLLTSNLVLGLEYTRINFKEQSYTGVTAGSIPFGIDRAKTDTDLLMARLSYKIGWPARGGATPLK